MLAELIENLEVTKACLRAAEADAAPNRWGIMSPAEMPLMVARQLFIRMYPGWRRSCTSWAPVASWPCPRRRTSRVASARDCPLPRHDTASAAERVRLFRLAWDTCCSAFASRQVLYERFFQGTVPVTWSS